MGASEQGVLAVRSPLGHLHAPIDAFRWNLFDVALHHGAVTRWGDETMRWLQEWSKAAP